MAQWHSDDCELDVLWNKKVDAFRCTIFLDKTTVDFLAQIDLFHDGSFRVQTMEACNVFVAIADDAMCLTRLKSGPW